MILYTIPTIIMFICFIIIIFIIGRKFYRLKLIDIETMPSEKERKIKDKIMIDRIRRKTSSELMKFEDRLFPLFGKMRGYFEKIYNSILELEKRYQEKGKRKPLDEDSKEKIRMMHNIAKECLDNNDLIGAENKYIEIISLDHRNIEAYKKLADIYIYKKDFKHAKEILVHSLKLNKKDEDVYRVLGSLLMDEGNLEEAKKNYLKVITLNPKNSVSYVDLFDVYKCMGDYENARRAIHKAVEIDSNNPKSLDLMAGINILLNNKKDAEYAYEKLKGVNPENKKLEEIKRKIDEMG